MNTFFNKYTHSQPMPYRREWTQPMMWSSGISGPVLVMFHAADVGETDKTNRPVYIDIRSILSIEQTREGGSEVVLAGGVYYDLQEPATTILKRLAEVIKEANG